MDEVDMVLNLPDELREMMKRPIGNLVNGPGLVEYVQGKNGIITVGDMVTHTLIKNSITPDLAIVDYIHKRNEYAAEIKESIKKNPAEVIKVANPAGMITDELWTAIKDALVKMQKNPVRIEVDGEEDLASLPAIYMAPEGATVIYGLPDRGVIIVPIDNAHRLWAKEILDKM